MKSYIVYLASGEILRTGQCNDSEFNLQGENVIEGIADDNKQYIDNNVIVNMPNKPDGESYFDFSSKQWVLNYPSQQNVIKSKRNKLLYESDWTQIPNNSLTSDKQQEWESYRQQLRDVTSQSGYPFNVVWPTQPE